MIYIGMDVHQKSTTFCLFDPSAKKKDQYRTVTRPTTVQGLKEVLHPHDGACQVAFEVGTQAQWVARIVRPLASDVQVANPSRIPWLFRDGRKNDRLDARKLATLLYLDQLPQVHLPAADVSAWRALINHRRTLVKRRTMAKLQIRAILRAFQTPCRYKNCWTKRGMAWLRSLTFDAARDLMVKTLLEELDFLNGKIVEIEGQLDDIAKARWEIPLLRTIPGVGPRTAEAIAAFADGTDRFGNGREFASYFGMTPTLDASGGVVRHGHISKRGPSVVRWVLVEAAHQTVRRCPALRTFYERVRHGKKDRNKKAIVAVGRKVLTIAYAMMRHNAAFDATKLGCSAA